MEKYASINSISNKNLFHMSYVLCMNCGRISLEGFFCSYCHSPLIVGGSSNPLNIEDGEIFKHSFKDPV